MLLAIAELLVSFTLSCRVGILFAFESDTGTFEDFKSK